MLYATNQAVLAKIETSYGVDPTPTAAANGILCGKATYGADGKELVRDFVRGSMSPLPHVIGRKLSTIAFETELKGNGSVNSGNPVEIDPLLRACGFVVSYSGAKAIYLPRSTAYESTTIYQYLDGVLRKVHGAQGTLSITLPAGDYAKVAWTFTGLYTIETAAALVSPTYDSTIPPIVQSAQSSLHGFSAVIQEVKIDYANTIAERPSINADDGLAGLRISGRKPTASVNPEMELPATSPFWSRWASASQGALTLILGTATGNTIKIHCARTQYKALNGGDRDGVLTYEIPLNLAGSSTGDDEIRIEFY